MNLSSFENLPVLPIDRCMHVFSAAKIGTSRLSELTRFSRVAIYRWLGGATPHPATQEYVSVLAYRTLRAIKHRKLPLPPRATTPEILRVLSDREYDGKSLADYAPGDLLPKKWLDELTAPDTNNETA